MQWQAIDRQKTIQIITAIERLVDPGLFTPSTTEIKCAHLPFYKNLALYRLTNMMMLPAFTMEFIGDGKTFYYLDGSDKPVFRANAEHGFYLTPETAAEYADFFLRSVADSEGERYVVFDKDSLSFLASMPMEDRQAIGDHNFTPLASFNEDKGGIDLSATLFYGGALSNAAIHIDDNGVINIGARDLVLQNVPAHYPDNPYYSEYPY